MAHVKAIISLPRSLMFVLKIEYMIYVKTHHDQEIEFISGICLCMHLKIYSIVVCL